MADTGFGRYELIERLSVRPASELFVVKVSGEAGFRRQIVLKRLRDDTQATKFIEDAKLSAKLSHAKIVQTLELGRIGDVPYMATEYVDGVTLLGLLRELARTKRVIDPALAAWIASEMLDALDYAHTFVDEGAALEIVHARLSPSKVLLGESGEVKLCDFGVPRKFDPSQIGEDYSHLSPEHVSEQPIGPRADVFVVGVLLAEMLGSRRLFSAHNEFDVLVMVRDVRLQRFDTIGLDDELVVIVKKALEKRPEDRWESATAFRDALDAWLFARRATGMTQQLASIVGDVRAEVDAWRRTDTPAFEFDDLPDRSAPVAAWAAAPARKPRTVAIPPRTMKTALDGITHTAPTTAVVPPIATPAAVPDRPAARGTVEPETTKHADALARGTEQSRARGTEQSPPLANPKEPVPTPIDPGTEPTSSKIHPRLLPRGPKLGVGLANVLPARTPTKQREPAVQPPSQEEVAKAPALPLPKLAKLERAADDGGDFERTSPLRVFFHLMRARATGLLAVTADVTRKDIYVRDGQLAGVWSNDPNDLFGNYLVAQKVLSEGELAMALATMSYYGGKIGDTLVGLGLLDRMEVFRQLGRHARTKVIDICTWTAGRYAWYAGREDPREAFPLEAEGFSMLGQAALALRPDVIDAWLVKHRDDTFVQVRTHRISAAAFALPNALDVYMQVDGVRTLGKLVGAHANRARILYLLMACDLIRSG